MSRFYSETGEDRDTADTHKRQKTDDDEGDFPFGKPLACEQFGDDDQVALKIRGLDFKASFDDVTEFFKDHKFIDKSVIFGTNSSGDFAGRKNGWGSILFETAKDAQGAADAL